MSRPVRSFARVLLGVLLGLALPAAAQSLRLEIVNSRREASGRIWGAGNWIAYFRDETEKSLNGDADVEDTVLSLINIRTLAIQDTGIAVDYTLADDDENRAVQFSGDWMAIQVSEAANGGVDLDGNGRAIDHVLTLYHAGTKRRTNLGIAGSRPAFLGGRLYFVRNERQAKTDLNGDGDLLDGVLCSYDLPSKQIDSLGMEAAAGFQVAGDWIAAHSSESAQAARDLNGDKDLGDNVVQLYQVSQKKWVNTGLEASGGLALTDRVLVLATEEEKQGGRDLNEDGDAADVVCQVWDLLSGTGFNTGQDCSGGVAADGTLVGFITPERSQGNRDLNGDGDMEDEVGQAYLLGGQKAVNLGRDASGGLVAGAGKLAFACSEAGQGRRDINQDRDAEDFVLMLYDAAKNRILNQGQAVDGNLMAAEGYLAWRVREADQFCRDLDRDGDLEDSILFVLDLSSHALGSTSACAGDSIAITASGVAFVTPEADQGRDLNLDRDMDDEILQIARVPPRSTAGR
jgi:hypothetical protein